MYFQRIFDFFYLNIDILNLFIQPLMIITILMIIIGYHIIVYLIRDKKYIQTVKKYKDPESISLTDLKSHPLINFILPAWKEGENFRECLLSITKLTYPNINVIVNAGGSEETLNIVDKFRKYDNFKILLQKGGKDRPSLGKIKAINDCLEHISEGLVFFIDADAYVTDEIVFRVIYPIVNLGKDVSASGRRPIEKLAKKDFVKYIDMSRYPILRFKYYREAGKIFSGSSTCMKFEVIKKIGKFSENKNYATDQSMAEDLMNNGFKIFQTIDYRANMYDAGQPYNFKTLSHQNKIWISNSLIYSVKTNKKFLFKFLILWGISFYLLIFPILLILNLSFIIIGLFLILSLYLKRVRRIVAYIEVFEKKYRYRLSILFYLKMIYYLYLEIIIIFITLFSFLKYMIKLKIGKH